MTESIIIDIDLWFITTYDDWLIDSPRVLMYEHSYHVSAVTPSASGKVMVAVVTSAARSLSRKLEWSGWWPIRMKPSPGTHVEYQGKVTVTVRTGVSMPSFKSILRDKSSKDASSQFELRCTASKLGSLEVAQYSKDGALIPLTLPDMFVEECSCLWRRMSSKFQNNES